MRDSVETIRDAIHFRSQSCDRLAGSQDFPSSAGETFRSSRGKRHSSEIQSSRKRFCPDPNLQVGRIGANGHSEESDSVYPGRPEEDVADTSLSSQVDVERLTSSIESTSRRTRDYTETRAGDNTGTSGVHDAAESVPAHPWSSSQAYQHQFVQDRSACTGQIFLSELQALGETAAMNEGNLEEC